MAHSFQCTFSDKTAAINADNTIRVLLRAMISSFQRDAPYVARMSVVRTKVREFNVISSLICDS